MAGASDVEMDDAPDVRLQPSAALVAQEKAEIRAKKRARGDQEAAALIDGGRGKRTAGEKANNNKVWMRDAARKKQGATEAVPEKDVEPRPKKMKVTEKRAKVATTSSSKSKNKVPASQRSPSPPPRATRSKKTVRYKSQAKSSRKRKAKDSGSDNDIESEDPIDSLESQSEKSDESDEDSTSASEEELDDDISESELAQQMGSELPISPVKARASASTRPPARLFEDDDIEVVHHRQDSDLPPSSDTEDPPSSIQRSSQENATAKQQTTQCKVKPSKAAGKRDAKFREERSSIVSASPRRRKKKAKISANLHAPSDGENVGAGEASDGDESDTVETWPPHARLRGSGHRDGLRRQNNYIRNTCRKAIKIVEKTLVTENAWPELNKGLDYRIEVLKKAAVALEKISPEYGDIRKRVRKDEEFAAIMGKWVIDRLSHARNPVRSAAHAHIAVYQLGVGEECVKRVAALLTCDAFVYPGKWETTSAGKPKWVVDGSKIYMNLSIINIIRSSFFATKTALGYLFIDEYKSTHDTLMERELTIPLVALAATGVFAALTACKDGQYEKKKGDKFDGETYAEMYNRQVKTLQDLQKDYKNIFHYVMSELYKSVVGNDGHQTAAAQMNALAIMDLNGVPGTE